jgi:hypothetical protein
MAAIRRHVAALLTVLKRLRKVEFDQVQAKYWLGC